MPSELVQKLCTAQPADRVTAYLRLKPIAGETSLPSQSWNGILKMCKASVQNPCCIWAPVSTRGLALPCADPSPTDFKSHAVTASIRFVTSDCVAPRVAPEVFYLRPQILKRRAIGRGPFLFAFRLCLDLAFTQSSENHFCISGWSCWLPPFASLDGRVCATRRPPTF